MTAVTTNTTGRNRTAAFNDSPARFAGHRGRPQLVVLDADATRAGTYAATPRARTFDRAAMPPAGGATVENLLRQRAELPADHPDRAPLRARSIEAGLPLARCLAARFAGRGEPLDDLYQVAALALVKAVDGYDPCRNTAFTTYAVPTIVGALKRYFRDATWRVRVPRPIQDLAVALAPATASLAQQLGGSPTPRDLARYLDTTEEEVALAANAWQAHHPDSLDAVSAAGGEQRPLVDTIGATDARLEAVIDWYALRPLLAALPAQHRGILAMRFYADMTQAQIAAEVGVSQMHISRLLARTLAQLRAGMLAEQRTDAIRPVPDQPTARLRVSRDTGGPVRRSQGRYR